ncbi:transposase [Microcystis wesenbergii]|uniref:transposase n=1 Tax=Microcystis wesenbergii TaxID=44823 RepID=UPI0035E3D94F
MSFSLLCPNYPALCYKAGCEVLFLPAYSPDINKIEKFWARLKNYVSQIINRPLA